MGKKKTIQAVRLLENFENALELKKITFISRKSPRSLTKPITDLKKALKSDNHYGHEAHKAGLELWRQLMSAAIRNIDPGAKGHSELLKYLKAATEFEDVLYGLEPFYRDHTLHSLWVYLLGVQLMGDGGELNEIAKHLNWYVFNDVKKRGYPKPLEEWACLEKEYLNEVIQNKKDAIWCIIALCHDLGYSLAKLRDLNKKVQAVLKFYHLEDYKHVGYKLDIEHQYLVTQLLELMAMEVRITPGSDYPENADENYEKLLCASITGVEEKVLGKLRQVKNLDLRKLPDLRKSLISTVSSQNKGSEECDDIVDLAGKTYDNVLTKCFRDDSSYWRLCKALERKEHGILSAFLLFKTVGLFADTSVRSPAEEWGLDDEEAIDNIIRGDILFAIAQHEFAFAHIDQMSSLAEVLILCDELEEFSRLGRQLQSREYHHTMADTDIKIVPQNKKGNSEPIDTTVNIEMTYLYSDQQKLPDFAKFCWRKSIRLCGLFSLGNNSLKNSMEPYLINEIKAVFKYSGKDKKDKPANLVNFTMQKNHRAVTIQIGAKKPVKLECRDDDIYLANKREMSLKKWLKGKDQLNIDAKDWPDSE